MYTSQILFLTFCGIIAYTYAGGPPDLKGLEKYLKFIAEEFTKNKDECYKESGATDEMFTKMKEDGVITKEVNCFTGCFWSKIGLLKDDFTMIDEKAKEINNLIENSKIKEMSEKVTEEIKTKLGNLAPKDKCSVGELVNNLTAKLYPKGM